MPDRKRIESRQRRRNTVASSSKKGGVSKRKTGRKKGGTRLKPIKSGRKSAKQQKLESMKGPVTHEQQLKETTSSSNMVFLQLYQLCAKRSPKRMRLASVSFVLSQTQTSRCAHRFWSNSLQEIEKARKKCLQQLAQRQQK